MALRLAMSVPLLVSLMAVGHAGAQGIELDRNALVEEVVQYMAERHQLPMDLVLLDTVRTGRIIATKPFEQRERVVPVAHMRGLASRLGIRLVETGAIRDCFTFPHEDQGRCQVPDPGLGLVIHAPAVSGDEAEVSVLYYLLRSELPVGTGESGHMRFEFRREDRKWHVVSAVVEVRGHHGRTPR
jgi:hypothetical protein